MQKNRSVNISNIKISVKDLFNHPNLRQQIFDLGSNTNCLSFKPTNIAIAFTEEKGSGTGAAVASLIMKVFHERTGQKVTTVCNNTISDAAALSIARYLRPADDIDSDDDSSENIDIIDDIAPAVQLDVSETHLVASLSLESNVVNDGEEDSSTSSSSSSSLPSASASSSSGSSATKNVTANDVDHEVDAKTCDMHNLAKAAGWSCGKFSI